MRILALITSLALSFAATADTVQLRDGAPDRHEVVKGDTLWDISAKFLKDPWKWPQVWQVNKDHIKNPHLIYLGDVILLTLTASGPQLSRLPTVKLGPQIHTEDIPQETAIPAVPYAVVRAFLQRPLVADAATLADAPRIIASEDNRVMHTIGDRVYAKGGSQDNKNWHVVRIGKVLKDPVTNQDLSREVDYVGDARTVVWDRPSTMQITRVDTEVLMDDRLIAETETATLDFVPHAPAQAVDGQIIAAYGAGQTAGKYSTLIINRGKDDGIEVGNVLVVYRQGKTLCKDRHPPEETKETGQEISSFNPKSGYLDAAREREKQVSYKERVDPKDVDLPPCQSTSPIKLPDVRKGLVMVYRVFDKVAYALVMDFSSPLYVLDHIGNP